MKNILILLVFTLVSTISLAQKDVPSHIKSLMAEQEIAWNNGDIDGFMKHYWNSEELMFVSSKRVNYGWQATYDGYKKGYPDKESMGTLKFDIMVAEQVGKKVCYVIGHWHLLGLDPEPQGHFTLMWKKIDGAWVIVSDHTS